MAWENMTVGRRIGVGFSAVLIILAVLGVAAYLGVAGIVGNGTEVIGGNKLDGNLAQKEVDHLVWANKVNALLTDEKVNHLEVQLDWHKCGFGEWYYGEGRKNAEQLVPSLIPLLTKIEDPHKNLHLSAKKIDELFKQPHTGLALTLSNRLADHIQWVSKVNESIANEAGGIYAYVSMLRNAAEQAQTTIEGIEGNMGAGISPRETAKNALATMRFGPQGDGFVFVMDANNAMLVHPQSNLVGKSADNITTSDGQRVFADLASMSQSGDRGFSYYQGSSGGKTVPMLALGKLYKPWNWVLGTSVTLDGADEALLQRAKDFVENKPFSLGVQLDPTQCAFGKFLASKETDELKAKFPAFRQAMDAVVDPHNRLHGSAREIQTALGEMNVSQALSVYRQKTLPALEEVKQHIDAAVTAEGELAQGFNEASQVYASQTVTHLHQVQELLRAIRQEAKRNIMTDEVMINSAQGTQRNVIVLGAVAIVLGIILAWFISRGLVRALSFVADGIGANSEQVATASGQVSQTSQSLAEGASEQAASLEETSSSLEEMSSMTRQNADNASQANALMEETRGVVTKAEISMKEMTLSMTEISDSGQEISKIIKTIDEIAFQTNLLALNAAVEAARAGEAGAGFAVVADEVRNLAQRAATAAKNTADLIEGTISKIDQGSKLVDEVSEAFSDVAVNANKVAELVGEIAAASSEQSQGIEQINQAMSQLDQVTQRNAANAEESASASEEMNAQAENMQDMVGQLLALVGRAQRALPRAIGAAKKVTARKPQLAAPRRKEQAQPPARVQQKPRTKEVKPDEVIPFDDDFKDF